jgi:hypothetical protein
MVGAPKHLHDLNKIEADVRITCRQCAFEVDWTVADLSAHLVSIGGSLAWSEVTRHLVCRRQGCGSRRLRATPVPFARRQANLPRQIGKFDVRIIATAMKVLEDAVARSPGRDIATAEVRLALLVVYVYSRDSEGTGEFWSRAGDAGRPAARGLHDPLGLIRQRLMERGWLAAAPVEERTPTWPWNSPAPPGWKRGAE